jgi:hypothetical protein
MDLIKYSKYTKAMARFTNFITKQVTRLWPNYLIVGLIAGLIMVWIIGFIPPFHELVITVLFISSLAVSYAGVQLVSGHPLFSRLVASLINGYVILRFYEQDSLVNIVLMVLVVGLVMFAFRAGDRTQRKHGV